MANLFKIYTKQIRKNGNRITNIIKDYYLCNNFEISFYDILKKYDILEFYPNIAIDCMPDFDFNTYQAISNYKTDKSVFYTEMTAPIIKECYKYVFKDLETYFKKNRLTLKKIVLGKSFRDDRWRPFIGVPCENTLDEDKKIILCSNEIYDYDEGVWYCKAEPEMPINGPILLGYIFKRIEEKIRKLYRFKYKLSTEITIIAKKITSKSIKILIQKPAFDQTIDNAVIKYFEQNHPRIFSNPETAFDKPIEVKIDISKLHKIRENANIIREKLTIEDDITPIGQKTEPLRITR